MVTQGGYRQNTVFSNRFRNRFIQQLQSVNMLAWFR
jgi:hypothetical protein